MKKLLMEFIERGWIEPSDSEWASPAFIVPKKERGEWRLVADYRGSNEQTEDDSYSLPLIDSILQEQQKKRIFTVLDLKHGYHQMPLHEDSRPCTAMSTPLGPMQWKVVPMGAKNGTAAFQRMMEDLLQPVRDRADPFVDDIIIGSGTEDMTHNGLIEAHEKDLRRLLGVLDKHSMVCKSTKASLFVREVEFAGHVVGHGQRRPMPGKLAALRHWGKLQKPSVNSGPSWNFAIIIRIMYECMRISRGLSTRCYRWASSMVAREARKNWHGQRKPKKRSTS